MSVALTSVERINALKNGIEATTGESYADLTAGVQALKNGYGQGGGTEELESLIDQSGVLESTDGTVTEKVEKLIDKAEYENAMYEASKEWTTQYSGLFNNNKRIEIMPRLSFENATTLKWLASYSTIRIIDYYINSPKATIATAAFQRSELEFMVGVDLSKVADASGVFAYSTKLREIQEPISLASSTNNSSFLWGCSSLVKIKFVPETIISSFVVPMNTLDAESVQSVFGGLSSTAMGMTLTLPSVFKNADKTTNTEAEAMVTANIEEVDGVVRIKGKEGWTLVR